MTEMLQDRLLVAPLRYFLYVFGDQSSNYDGVFILFSILLCFFCIQNLHVYRVLIVLLSVYMGCREFFNVP
mgnify:CR=1 FL=1